MRKCNPGKPERPEYSEYQEELKGLSVTVWDKISDILMSPGRIAKHLPYTWKDEPEDEHLNKAVRHILTHQIQRDGQQPDDGEDHLANALTRLAMAVKKQEG